jgi:hypothetical protein
MMGKRSVRLWQLVTGLAVVFAAAGFGAQAAAAAPAPPAPGAASIAALYGSTKLAVSGLQKAPNGVRILAAKVIIAEAKVLLTARGATPAGPVSTTAEVAAAGAAALPGTDVGGLDLDAYCQSIGDAYSYTPDPGNEVPGAAYTWSCVSGSGAKSPIFMQSACNQQYPGQVTIAYPQDTNNAYSWICLAPAAGTYSNPGTGTTVATVTAANGAATLITTPGNSYLAVDDNGSSAADLVNSNGSGYMAYDGSTGGSVLTYDGSGGGSV